MASKYWIKLYHEILDDPKMGCLPDELWRRTIELFLLAGENHNAGALPSLGEMVWKLRIAENDLFRDLQELEERGIVYLEDGIWIVTNFAKRQKPASNAERVRRHRALQRSSNEVCNDTVTKTVIDTDIDIDTNTDQTKDKDAGASGPSTFPEWQKRIRDEKNQVGVIMEMCDKLYPDNEKPTGGHIGRAIRSVGGAGRLLDLLWQHSSRPPTGNPVTFVQGIAKREKRDEPKQPPKGRAYR